MSAKAEVARDKLRAFARTLNNEGLALLFEAVQDEAAHRMICEHGIVSGNWCHSCGGEPRIPAESPGF